MQIWGRRADGTVVDNVDVELHEKSKTTAGKVFWPSDRPFKVLVEFEGHREVIALGCWSAVSVSVGLCDKPPPEPPE